VLFAELSHIAVRCDQFETRCRIGVFPAGKAGACRNFLKSRLLALSF
jgi:hypothetical protein